MILLKPVLVQRVVNYECGCQCIYHVLGQFSGVGWNIIPCYTHAELREEVEQRAETDWRLITNGKL